MKNFLIAFGLILTFGFSQTFASFPAIEAGNGAVTTKMVIPSKLDRQARVTRAQFLQALLSASEKSEAQCRKIFRYTDVDWSADYGNALQTASCLGIVKGNPDGTFAPNKQISYAAAAKIASEGFNIPMTLQANLNPQWYDSYIFTMKRTRAVPRKDMNPSDTITHQEMRHIINTLKNLAMNDNSNAGKTADKSEMITLEVGPNKVDCMGVAPMKCLSTDQGLWYDHIEGFDFESGFEYRLQVKKTPRPEPIPADASAFTYELVQIVTKTPLKTNAAELNGSWAWKHMISLNDETTTPKKSDAFTITFNNNESQVSGTTDCNNFSGTFNASEGLEFGPIAMTRKACFGETQETEFIGFLSETTGYEVINGTLTLLLGGKEKMMVFTR